MRKNKLGTAILDLVFPQFCYHCGKMGAHLCDNCYSRLELPLDPYFHEAIGFRQVQVGFVYNQLLGKMLRQYKYLGVADLAATFGHWLYQFVNLPAVEVITYIPLHRQKLRQRGFNQAALLAQVLGQKMGCPCLPLLTRTQAGVSQARQKTAAERLSALANPFAASLALTRTLTAQTKILLVDDVVTTGRTLSHAAASLQAAGLKQLYGVALAHSQ